jgi:hypothetical protein
MSCMYDGLPCQYDSNQLQSYFEWTVVTPESTTSRMNDSMVREYD